LVHTVHQMSFYVHVCIGSMVLIIFWLPFFTKKGDKRHRFIGKFFTNGMYAMAVSGVVMSSLVLFDPLAVRYPNGGFDPDLLENIKLQNRISAGFLFTLSVLVFNNVRQAVLVLKAKAQRELLKTPAHLAGIGFLSLLGVTLGVLAVYYQALLFGLFAALCLANSAGMFRYVFKQEILEREWIIVHLTNICAAGIAAYTAFFVFGGRQLLAGIFTGNLQVITWIMPAIIGTIAISILSKKYKKQFRVQ
jgi:hypothetical protein